MSVPKWRTEVDEKTTINRTKAKLRLRRLEDRLAATYVEIRRLRADIARMTEALEKSKAENLKRDE